MMGSPGNRNYETFVDLMDDASTLYEKIFNQLPLELQICMVSGCEMEFLVDCKTNNLTIKTKYPVAIKEIDGKWYVAERKPDEQDKTLGARNYYCPGSESSP